MASHNRSEWSGTKPRGGFLTSPAGLVLIGFLAIAGIYLWMEHRAHLLGTLVWLPLLACPLMPPPSRSTSDRVATPLVEVEESADRRTVLAPIALSSPPNAPTLLGCAPGLPHSRPVLGPKPPSAKSWRRVWSSFTSSVLVLFSAFCFGAAVWCELFPGPPPPWPDVPRLPPALLLSLNGFLILVALIALAGIWIARTPGS
jgi:putative membrane protein